MPDKFDSIINDLKNEIKEVDNSDGDKVYIQQTFTDGTTGTVTIKVTNARGPKGDKGANSSEGFVPRTRKIDGSTISFTGASPGGEVASAGFSVASCSAGIVSASLTGASLGLKGASMNLSVVEISVDGLCCSSSVGDSIADSVKNATNLGKNVLVTAKQVLELNKNVNDVVDQKATVSRQETGGTNNTIKTEVHT